MSKYIDADRLKAEINNRKKSLRAGICGEAFTRKQKFEMLVASEELDRFNRIIDSLQQEQPEVDFKIEERKWVHDAVDNIFPEDGDFMSEVDFRKILKDTAHHFYELGLRAKEE